MEKIGLSKSNIRLLLLVAFYVLYLVIGASIYSAIEGPQERVMVKNLRSKRVKFLEAHRHCLTGSLFSLVSNYREYVFPLSFLIFVLY